MNSKIQFYLFVCIFCLAFTYVNTKSSPLTRPQQIEVRTEQDALRKPQDIEVRDNYPGLTAILGAGATVLESVVAYILGQGSIDDITSAIQGVFFQIQKMISIQGLVGQIPMFGFILQPLVGIIAMIMSNTPMLGILEIIGAIFDVPKHILAFIAGKGPFSGITSAISDVIFQIRKFVSVQGIVGVIPILGYILQPLVGLMAMILYHIPFIGGIIRYILVGPSE